MGILVLENGVKKSLSNDAFINKYGDHPQIARFSRDSLTYSHHFRQAQVGDSKSKCS